MKNLLEVKNLTKTFQVRGKFAKKEKRKIKAVNSVSFFIKYGETFGLVGESGCGKTTIGRCIVKLLKPDAGEIYLENQALLQLKSWQLKPTRKKIQMIFQDPLSSLDPRLSAFQTIAEGIKIHKLVQNRKDLKDKVYELARQVGLEPADLKKYPHQFSGGQRQRIGIARALALNPIIVVADEPLSALDLSVQAQILDLLLKLQQERNLSYLFISHNLAVVAYLCQRTAVMYAGTLVEEALTSELFSNPLHPYTKTLIAAIPKLGSTSNLIKSTFFKQENSEAINLGCPYSSYCQYFSAKCKELPPMIELNKSESMFDHKVRCILHA